ncbi:MAG: isoprenylcysteine carboxylmethyltransferase family protein [candidate division WOR-3 bacterium]|nr:MAG: isoprenylcysteine carboxylmethyltransferase family protein [candidate division WOR-3 bacterium]
MNTMPRSKLIGTVVARFGAGAVVMGLLFFGAAGTFRFWQAWVFMAILFIPMFFVVLYLIRNDPALIERRMRTREREPFQKKSQIISTILYLLAFLIPGLDHRFGWSSLPVAVVIVADVFVFLGYLLFILVLRENSYASRVVDVEVDQKVVSTGPYSLVRHPMYFAALMIFFFSPAALGSLWALFAIIPATSLLVPRIIEEERLLSRELSGYESYKQKVRYRLIPMVW